MKIKRIGLYVFALLISSNIVFSSSSSIINHNQATQGTVYKVYKYEDRFSPSGIVFGSRFVNGKKLLKEYNFVSQKLAKNFIFLERSALQDQMKQKVQQGALLGYRSVWQQTLPTVTVASSNNVTGALLPKGLHGKQSEQFSLEKILAAIKNNQSN